MDDDVHFFEFDDDKIQTFKDDEKKELDEKEELDEQIKIKIKYIKIYNNILSYKLNGIYDIIADFDRFKYIDNLKINEMKESVKNFKEIYVRYISTVNNFNTYINSITLFEISNIFKKDILTKLNEIENILQRSIIKKFKKCSKIINEYESTLLPIRYITLNLCNIVKCKEPSKLFDENKMLIIYNKYETYIKRFNPYGEFYQKKIVNIFKNICDITLQYTDEKSNELNIKISKIINILKSTKFEELYIKKIGDEILKELPTYTHFIFRYILQTDLIYLLNYLFWKYPLNFNDENLDKIMNINNIRDISEIEHMLQSQLKILKIS